MAPSSLTGTIEYVNTRPESPTAHWPATPPTAPPTYPVSAPPTGPAWAPPINPAGLPVQGPAEQPRTATQMTPPPFTGWAAPDQSPARSGGSATSSPAEKKGSSLGRFAAAVAAGLAIAVIAASAGFAGGRLAANGTAPAHRTTVDRAANPSGAAMDVTDVVDAVHKSVVTVNTSSGTGSGFVISVDGEDQPLVVTNAHVVEGAGPDDVTVSVDGADPVSGSVLGRNPDADIAVIAVEGLSAPPLVLREAPAEVGEPVVAIGNALDLGRTPSVTSGIVSATGRSIPGSAEDELSDLIQTDTAINPGNSGGPLLDAAGQVIGVNTAIINPSVAQNVGFAIPAATVRQLVAGLSKGTRLGVQLDPSGAAEGPTVVAVVPGSAAEQAGIQVGDVVLSLAGTDVTDAKDLVSEVSKHSPGDVVDVVLIRDGEQLTVSATLTDS